MRNRVSSSEYLALLSLKYEVDADRFFEALVTAGKNRKSACGSLSIERRQERGDKIVLLITNGPKVVAQFPLSREFLMEQNNPIKIRTDETPNRRSMKQYRKLQPLQIKDLRVGMKRINLKAEILEVSEPVLVVTRFGNMASVANALVCDETGKIRLCLWNDQISSVSAGDTVKIENASISMFRGERQLRVGKKGLLRIAPEVVAN
jgi:replication factor A1